MNRVLRVLGRAAVYLRGASVETSGRVHHEDRDSHQQGCDPLQEPLDRAATRQMEADPILVLSDQGGHFEEREDDGGGLGVGQGGVPKGLGPQGMVEHVRGTGQEQPHGVGAEGRRRGAVAV